jgi:biopolymer transport protein ExbD
MAMNLSASGGSGEPEVLVDINTTPLIDVMLVLLIMLIVTIPVKLHAVHLELPDDSPQSQTLPEPETVRIEIAAGGTISWNGEAVPPGPELDARLAAAAARPVQPELHVHPDRHASYRYVARVFAAAQRNGAGKIGIVGQEELLPR